MESEMICDNCRRRTYLLNQLLGEMVCSKCYHEIINSIQIAANRFIAFPLNWIIMAAYWIWQVFDVFALYKTENKVGKNSFDERNSGSSHS
jgi:hypothetical protein